MKPRRKADAATHKNNLILTSSKSSILNNYKSKMQLCKGTQEGHMFK